MEAITPASVSKVQKKDIRMKEDATEGALVKCNFNLKHTIKLVLKKHFDDISIKVFCIKRRKQPTLSLRKLQDRNIRNQIIQIFKFLRISNSTNKVIVPFCRF